MRVLTRRELAHFRLVCALMISFLFSSHWRFVLFCVALLAPPACAQSRTPQRAVAQHEMSAWRVYSQDNENRDQSGEDYPADENFPDDNFPRGGHFPHGDDSSRDRNDPRDNDSPRGNSFPRENATLSRGDDFPRDNGSEYSLPNGNANGATEEARRAVRGNLPLRLPGPVPKSGAAAVAPRFTISAQARAYAERAVRERRLAQAADAFRQEAAIYRRRGLRDAALIQERRAARYETDLRFFIDRQPTSSELRTLDTNARLEPSSGAYLGAFIDRDDALPRTFYGTDYQTHRYPRDFEQRVGRRHASYFTYLAYGQPFPILWAQTVKAAGAIPHIAWEPKSLNAVRDDNYLRYFARDCARLKWPVFIRFAGEMNGFWTPYHGDPKLYREKFRLINRTLHKTAPQAATIWCVNSVPSENIAAYYPGDDGCDWVGINLYAVAFYDNNPRRVAFEDNPLALIEPIYREYSRRKPIALCEFAASHLSATDGKPRVQLAIEKAALLYGALPRLFPRIKMVDWFSMNTIKHARPGRQLNNYSLTAQPALTETYRRVTEEPFFLKRPRVLAFPVSMPFPVAAQQKISGGAALSIWAKTYTARPKVFLQIGKEIVYGSDAPGAHITPLLANNFPAGKQRATAYIFDERDRFVARRDTILIFAAAPPPRLLR